MLVELALFLAGLALLLYGANTVVTEAGQLALFYGVSTFFVGVTVISIGTSIPEMTTSIYAAYYGAGDLVVGNIVGSEIAQVTLAIGIVALIAPVVARRTSVIVYGGGQLMVTNGVELARVAGVSEYLVGLFTGLGTTLPEIVVAGIAAREGDSGISVGALLGSNITDPVFSLGLGAIVADVAVTDVGPVLVSATYMVVVSLVVLGLLYWRRGLDRRAALVCIALYLPSFLVI